MAVEVKFTVMVDPAVVLEAIVVLEYPVVVALAVVDTNVEDAVKVDWVQTVPVIATRAQVVVAN